MKAGTRKAPARHTLILTAAALLAGPVATAGAQAKAKPASKPVAKAKTAAKTAAKATPRAFVIAPDGNEARYRVRERLLDHDLDNDAIGATRDIVGRLFVDGQGRVVADSSRIVVGLKSLKSDQARRDGFLQNRTLQTDSFPSVTIMPTAIRGGTGTLPTSGTATFELLANLTIRGVTRPTVWAVTARADGGAVAGTASTAFTFKDFALDQPRVRVLLSVADTIKLEYDFRFLPATPQP